LAKAVPQGTSCYGKKDGLISIQVQGGVPPYSVNTPGQNQFSSQIELSNLGAGQYDWKVIDSNGCVIPVTFQITSPPALVVDVRLEKPACPGGSYGELFVTPGGGSGPFIYRWSNPTLSGQYVVGLAKGEYELEVEDNQGCVSLGKGIVNEEAPQIRMPNGFAPTQLTGFYAGVSNCDTRFELSIYNRWGQLIYFGSEGWDGMISGDFAPPGTYSYSVNYYYQLEGKSIRQNLKGSFALIR